MTRRSHTIKARIWWGVVVLITSLAFTAAGQLGPGQASGQIPQQDKLQERVDKSTAVVWGLVSATESNWKTNELGHHIFTTVTVEIVQSVKASVTGTLVFEVVGGTIGETTEAVSNVPMFRQGQEVILFMTGDPYRLIGGRYSKLTVYDGKVYWTGVELTAEVFLEMLELIEAGQSPASVWQQEKSQQFEAFGLTNQPVITRITPSKASAGTDTQVTITGNYFGFSQGSGKVEFYYDGVSRLEASIVSWSDRSIVCTVPVGTVDDYSASTGSGPVTVRTSAGTSYGMPFRVTFGYDQMHWDTPTVHFKINENTSDCVGEGAAVRRAANT